MWVLQNLKILDYPWKFSKCITWNNYKYSRGFPSLKPIVLDMVFNKWSWIQIKWGSAGILWYSMTRKQHNLSGTGVLLFPKNNIYVSELFYEKASGSFNLDLTVIQFNFWIKSTSTHGIMEYDWTVQANWIDNCHWITTNPYTSNI